MFRTKNNVFSVMILYAIILHYCWAALLLIDSSALGATGVSSIYRYVHSEYFLVSLLVVSSSLSVAGLIIRRPWSVLLLTLQQCLLMMSAAGALQAIFVSQYADGVIRAWPFIAADQIGSVIAACGHTLAMILRVLNREAAR